MNKAETHKAMPYLEKFCQGIGLDIGCGAATITPLAIGIDPRGDIADYSMTWQEFLAEYPYDRYDYIYSSALLEDYSDCNEVLQQWIGFIRKGGLLILFLPVESIYKAQCKRTGQVYNVCHRQDWTGPDDFWAKLSVDIKSKLEVVETSGDVIIGGYMFYVVLRVS